MSMGQISESKSVIERFFAPTWRAIIAGVVSALLLVISYPPSQLGWLAWIALVPLLLATYGRKRSETYIVVLVWALACVVGSTDLYFWQKSPVFVFILLASTVIQTVFVSEIQLLARKFNHQDWILIACLWTSFLFLIGRLLSNLDNPLPPSLPFISIANSQWLYPPVIQILSVTGEYGLIFLILLVNTGLAETLRSCRQSRRWWLPFVFVLVLALANGLWGLQQLERQVASQTVGVAILPDESYHEMYLATNKTHEFMQMIASNPIQLPNGAKLPEVKLIAWDESPVGDLTNASVVSDVSKLARELNVYLIANFTAAQSEGMPQNVATVFGPDGALLAQNAKKVIPMIIENSTPGDRNLAPEIVTTPWGRMTTLICYETLFPDLVRQIARSGVDFFVVPAYAIADAPRGGSIHLAQTIFRSAENHTAIVFSYASGVSALMDARGRLLIHSPFPIIGKKLGTVMATVSALPVNSGGTLYTQIGDVFAWVIMLLSIGWIGYAKIFGKNS